MKLTAAKCPSCGADIQVDRSLKFTKCEYCNSRIVVEEAIENLIQVELKDTPTLDNYLKLGNRYYENREFGEAYQVYAKAEEIDPDNPLVVLRKGLARSMVTDYNHFDVNSAINGLKNSLELMKKMSFSRKDMNQSIDEVGAVLYASRNYLIDVYQNNKLTKAQTTGYIERMEACLDGFIYLDSVVVGDKALEDKIVHAIIETIDFILGNRNDARYHLSSSYVTKLREMKKEYEGKVSSTYSTPSTSNKKTVEKVVEVESKSSLLKDILCYLMIFFLAIMLLGSLFNHESIFVILIWVFAIISFVPQLKKIIVKRFGTGVQWSIIAFRVIILVIAFMMLASGDSEFENTYRGEDNVLITLEDGKFMMKTANEIIEGEYHWDTKDNDFYIHVQGNDNQNYEYRYRDTSEGGSLCLLKNGKCHTIYLPVD